MISIRRRSKVSANAPDGNASSTIGNMLAVCTNETNASAPGTSMSSHCAPTVCIQVPMLDASNANHNHRNVVTDNGAQADPLRDATSVTLPAVKPS
ncbi:hypothetical protein Ais01nite_82500 [Asanoa ishikariensis]|nr:hypothetical protein Ais01nite_82500 [Asanoa ishikariensis]